jgi:hypothetical protein
MKFRRRNWWFRRMALGLAFAAIAAPAAAQPDESTNGTARATVTAGGWTGAVDSSGIPLSAGIPSGDEPFLVDPYLTDVYVRPGEALSGPDGGSVPADNGAAAAVQATDNAAPAPADSGFAVGREEAFALGLGALALALAIGLAVGYARRPRIAGL